MERFFGGNPLLVLIRLSIISLIVGMLLAAFGFSPFEIVESLQRLATSIYNMGFRAVEEFGRYFLLGAVLVFPIWLVARVLKVMMRSNRSTPANIDQHH
ncbi:DUF6460 domain-containing protein [Methyloligella sp. 2.7D]|uniref:DUF6460 domain-containing protein n=1 Tax=unclassified Methyloligella TaxID=2625955 RepID=UPI00157D48D7|nr:DUF6460 domain-containing protein [Methyloligella sp. GL2]QKP78485.1 integrase [Methyloligella sp. GL2]